MTIPFKYYLVLYSFLFLLKPCSAHGDLDARINSATELINIHVDSASLYLNRAELYFQHEEYAASIADFNQYFSFNNNDNRAYLGVAKSFFKTEQYSESLIYLDKILKTDSEHVLTIRWKAKVLIALKQYESAALHFESVIKLADKSMTDNYLEAANAWLMCEDDVRIVKAINTLNQGITDLGPLLVFYNSIVRILEENKDFEQAILYQTKIINESNRKEFALMKRVELLLAIHKSDEALNDLQATKQAINSLPKSKQNYSAIINLKEKIIETELLLNRQNEIK